MNEAGTDSRHSLHEFRESDVYKTKNVNAIIETETGIEKHTFTQDDYEHNNKAKLGNYSEGGMAVIKPYQNDYLERDLALVKIRIDNIESDLNTLDETVQKLEPDIKKNTVRPDGLDA